jgi:hypothetical protein
MKVVYNSDNHMKEKYSKPNSRMDDEENPNGYPAYPPDEDIYGKFQKDRSINPEDPANLKKRPVSKASLNNEKDFDDDFSGDDLDIPGSDSDDDLEMTGDEDEENSYYSLGGDNHNDLEEDYGE